MRNVDLSHYSLKNEGKWLRFQNASTKLLTKNIAVVLFTIVILQTFTGYVTKAISSPIELYSLIKTYDRSPISKMKLKQFFI